MSSQPVQKEAKIDWSTAGIKTRVDEEIDRCVDHGEKLCEQSSNTLSFAFLPTIFSSIASILEYCGVPEAVSKPIAALGAKKGADFCSPIVARCREKTCSATREALHKCGDRSVDTSYSFYQKCVSWWNG